MQADILTLIKERGIVLGDGGYLIELERREAGEGGDRERQRAIHARGGNRASRRAPTIAHRISARRVAGFAGAYLLWHAREIEAGRLRRRDRSDQSERGADRARGGGRRGVGGGIDLAHAALRARRARIRPLSARAAGRTDALADRSRRGFSD